MGTPWKKKPLDKYVVLYVVNAKQYQHGVIDAWIYTDFNIPCIYAPVKVQMYYRTFAVVAVGY